MKKWRISVSLLSIFLLLVLSSVSLAQARRQRPPWNERSPAIGKKVPDAVVFDKNLNKIPFTNFYEDTILVIQWGGCT